jgi:branched-chain amino acid transport system substrate-binding protein
MSSLPSAPFAVLLRRHRLARGLTQEELAGRANLSVQAIGALERGDRRAPRKETVDLLAEALALTEAERAALEDAARQYRVATPPPALPPTPAAAPTQVTPPPADSPLLPSGPQLLLSRLQLVMSGLQLLIKFVQRAPSWPLGGRGKLVVGLCLVLFLGTSLLAGSHLHSAGGTLCLATDFPTEDRYVAVTPLIDAINLAMMQNQHLENGYTLKLINYDDTSQETHDGDSEIGAHNVQQMVHTHCIVGMIGPLNSAVAVAEMPIAANAGLVMISPANTLSGLTLRPYAALEGWDFDQLHPTSKPLNYFRIEPNDVAQGLAAADFTFDDLGARNVYVVNDREQFGEDLVGSFTQGFEVKGGRIVGIGSIPSANLADIADLAVRIADTNPDAVFYAGLTDGGGQLKAQLATRGYTGPFVGGDGIATDPGFVAVAGADAANGTLAISPVAHPSSVSSDAAAQFFHDFAASYPGQRLDPDAAEAYDAAMVLITAIKHLIRAGQPVTREAMIQQVQHIQYVGAIGPISFDSNGDIAHGVFSLYRVQDGLWTYFQQVRV